MNLAIDSPIHGEERGDSKSIPHYKLSSEKIGKNRLGNRMSIKQ